VDDDRVGERVTEPGGGGPAPVGGTVVDNPEHPFGAGVRLAGHHFWSPGGEGSNAGAGGAVADHPSVVDVVGGEVGQGAVPAVLGFEQCTRATTKKWLCQEDENDLTLRMLSHCNFAPPKVNADFAN
jgi:hypothetical protein